MTLSKEVITEALYDAYCEEVYPKIRGVALDWEEFKRDRNNFKRVAGWKAVAERAMILLT